MPCRYIIPGYGQGSLRGQNAMVRRAAAALVRKLPIFGIKVVLCDGLFAGARFVDTPWIVAAPL